MDYTPTSADLTFSPANPVGSFMPLNIPITNDNILEGIESFFVQLSIAGSSINLAITGTPNVAPVTIADDSMCEFLNGTYHNSNCTCCVSPLQCSHLP